ncbi:MAG TPA: FG-GAP-like repeat-containing protein [Puia sp.]|nr:FG-GAP-like repeat-containing protein [Puia sp.]
MLFNPYHMVYHSCCKRPVLFVLLLVLNILPARSQPVGGLGKITDSAFTPITFPGFMAGPEVRLMVSFDMDGDGKRDVAAINSGGFNSITVLRNTSTPGVPNFNDVTPLFLATGNAPSFMAYGDMDGDGKQDILVVNNIDNNIGVYRNTSTPGQISFDTAINFGPVTYASDIVIDDFDHDGRLDIAVSNVSDTPVAGYTNIGIFLNTSSPGHFSFRPMVDVGTPINALGMASHDLDGDSLPDLVYCPYPSDKLCFLINTSHPGSVSFDSLPSATVGSYSLGTAIGDLDGDGKPDIAVACLEDSSIYLLRNTSVGGVFSYQLISVPHVGNLLHSGPDRITIADLNLDGKADLIVRLNNNTSGAFLQNTATAPGSFSFAPPLYMPLVPDDNPESDPYYEFEAASMVVDDYDGDGKPDLLLTNYRSRYTIFYNTLNLRRNRINEPHVVPSGASPVTDTIAFYTTIDTTVQTYKGSPYLQRHYDIEPVSNAATSTATVTLYYTQQDFDNYNALAAHGDNLPSGPADTIDKTHIRLLQYHGTSDTHTPGSYSGNDQLIDPDDNKIVWNDPAARWEITFDITGFSGFFLASSGTVLPLTLLSFTGQRQGVNVLLDWITTHEVDVSRFELQRSTLAGNFATIATIPSVDENTYAYTDTAAQNTSYFYRLRMIDIDGKYTYSRIVAIEGADGSLGMTLFPNPATNIVTVQHPEADASARIQLSDRMGRVLRTITPASGAMQTPITLTGLAAGIYQVQWSDGHRVITSSLLVK